MVWGWGITVVALVAASWWFFHRDPDRYSPPVDGWMSPADGVVSKVVRVDGDSAFIKKHRHGFTAMLKDFPEAKYLVVIMLKFWHVHTQRAPNDGTVSAVMYKQGGHQNAVFGDWESATVENEHFGVTIDGERQSRVYLVAGLLARRIVPMVSEGDVVQQGQRIGRIRLGSQTVLVLPECKVKVQAGDRVYGGLTEVAG